MNIVRDLLDKQLVDNGRFEVGKIDGIIVESGEDDALFTQFVVGPVPALRRISPRLAERLRRFMVRRGWGEGEMRIPAELLLERGIDVKVDISARESPALALENDLQRLIRIFPGG
jgi:hypothetical protein